jgi:hypothetical protein
MKKEFMDYLGSIDIKGEVLIDRIESIYEFYKEMCPDEIVDIFVTDYIDSEGGREYENLWFFSDKYIMEAKEFAAGKDDFDITPIKDRVKYCKIQKKDYDFKEAIEKSRLRLEFTFGFFGARCDFKAAKENCDALRDIILKHVKPNMRG